MSSDEDGWVLAVCDVPSRMHRENRSLLDCFRAAAPDLTDDDGGTAAIERHLRENPQLVEVWQRESDDTRASPNPYLDGCIVGFYDSGHRDETVHNDAFAACADFVYRKAVWVLERRRAREEMT